MINSYQTALDIAKRPANTREVIAAARDIPPGEVITEDDLVLKRVSVGDVAVDDLYGSEDELLGGAVSERIRISTAATNHNTRHPIVTAGFARTMQSLTGGLPLPPGMKLF